MFLRVGFLDSPENSTQETSINTFGLKHFDKSAWALGVNIVY